MATDTIPKNWFMTAPLHLDHLSGTPLYIARGPHAYFSQSMKYFEAYHNNPDLLQSIGTDTLTHLQSLTANLDKLINYLDGRKGDSVFKARRQTMKEFREYSREFVKAVDNQFNERITRAQSVTPSPTPSPEGSGRSTPIK